MADAQFGGSEADADKKQPSESNQSNITSYETARVDWWIGFLGGMYPIKNGVTTSTATNLRISIVSWNFAYSILLLVFKTVALVQFWYLIDLSLRQRGYTPSKMSDYYAGVLAILFTYCTGPFVQIMCLWNLRPFVEFMQCLEGYEIKYPHEVLHVRHRRLVYVLIHIIIVNYVPVYGLCHLSDLESLGVEFHIIPGLWSTTSIVVVRIYLVIAFIFLELGSLFFGVVIFFPSRTVVMRLEQLLTNVRSFAAESDKSLRAGKWEAFGNQYTDFFYAFKTYQRFVGPFLTFTFGVTMTSCTCLIYYLLTSRSVEALHFTGTRPTLWLVVILMIGRFFTMTGCGHWFHTNHRKLVYELMKAYHKEMEHNTQAKRVIKLVTLSSVGSLSASGFFMVGRRNITSIVSTILTYIVVFYQFRINDKSQGQERAVKDKAQ